MLISLKILSALSIALTVYVVALTYMTDFTDFIILLLVAFPVIFHLFVLFDPKTFNSVVEDPYLIGYAPNIVMAILYILTIYLYRLISI